jgi:hypothetical protein
VSRSLGEKSGKWVQDNHPEIASFFGVTGLTALDIFSYASFETFIALTVLAFSGIPLSHRRNRSLKSEGEQNHTLRQVISEGHRNFYDVWDDKAREIYQDLELDIRARLSLYKYDGELKKFR